MLVQFYTKAQAKKLIYQINKKTPIETTDSGVTICETADCLKVARGKYVILKCIARTDVADFKTHIELRFLGRSFKGDDIEDCYSAIIAYLLTEVFKNDKHK